MEAPMRHPPSTHDYRTPKNNNRAIHTRVHGRHRGPLPSCDVISGSLSATVARRSAAVLPPSRGPTMTRATARLSLCLPAALAAGLLLTPTSHAADVGYAEDFA